MSAVAGVRTRVEPQRLLDICTTLLLLPIAVPVIGLAMAAIAIDSRGPVVLRQLRIGRDGRPFVLYKLRTLRGDRAKDREEALLRGFVRGTPIAAQGGNHKPFDAAAVTRVGRFLRRTSIDELPQLLNVLVGQMSIVGPRPHLPCEVEEYLPWHFERLQVRPGITGLAQLGGRSASTFDEIVRADVVYLRSRSLRGDLAIMTRTLLWVAIGRGAG